MLCQGSRRWEEVEEPTERRVARLEPEKDESGLSVVEPHREAQEDED